MARFCSRRQLRGLEKLEQRQLLAGDVLVRMEITDLLENPQAEFNIGEELLLRVHVRDNRPDAEGVFQSFFDVNYDSTRLAVSGAIEFGDAFDFGTSGSTTVPGLVDEAGGIDADQTAPTPPGAEELLMSIPFRATAAGTVTFTADLAESPLKAVLLFDSVVGVDLDDIDFEGGTVEIRQAAIMVSPTAGLQTSEQGASDTFQISLTNAPTSNVTVGLTSSDATEGSVTPSSITFTPTDWATPKDVTVAGLDDDIADGNTAFSIITAPAVSDDPQFAGSDPADVAVSNLDNDSAGILVSPTTGQTTEAGGTTSFSVVLTSEPTSTVTIGLSSSDTSEGTVSPASLSFNSQNWDALHIVAVTGQDDFLADGIVAYTIITQPAQSLDPGYDGRSAADVAVTNVDDDSAGILVQPTTGQTTEAGGTASFDIVLTSQPTGDVVIGLTSDNPNEGTVLPTSVTFSPDTWNVAQAITATGQDDDVADGNIAYAIVTAAAASTDPNYDGRQAPDVALTNLDDDAVGITVQPIVGETTEGSGITDIALVLDSRPTASVTIDLTSSDETEGVVSPSSVTFTTENWSVTQLVTIVGQDDFIADGNVAYTVFTEPATSADSGYEGWNAADVSMVNVDDDAAGFRIVDGDGLETTEAGGTATFRIALTSQPVANVTVPIQSSNVGEGSVITSSLVFTPENWDQTQAVTVAGVDDDQDDGDVQFQVLFGPAQSSDAGYSGRESAGPLVTNLNDDEAGITITANPPLTTTESGGSTEFFVVLLSEPFSNVQIDLETNDPTEGTVLPISLLFDETNWDVPQQVVATGVDDPDSDGDVVYRVLAEATSSDAAYDGLVSDQLELVNLDNDTPGISITPTTGVGTSESGASATVQVVLATRPTADVLLEFESGDLSEGTVEPTTLVFNSDNWSSPQLVTVTGVDDDEVDGDVSYSLISLPATSADPDYSGLDPADVEVSNLDNDVAEILLFDDSDLVVTEAGQSATFGIALSSQPSSDVTINVRSSDLTEGTVSPATITLTPTNWQTPQDVVVTGQDDPASDGDVAFSIIIESAISDDANYSGLDAPDVPVTNIDDDFPGVTLIDAANLQTTEAGSSVEFGIILNVQPLEPVTFDISLTDSTEGQVSPAQITFTPANWDTSQQVTVTGVDDFRMDGDVTYEVTIGPASSSDPAYDGIDPSDVPVTNLDDDVAGIEVTPVGGLVTSESGGNVQLQVRLTSQPTEIVVLEVASNDQSEGAAATQDLTFNQANWNVAQVVDVNGVDDFVDDDDVAYAVSVSVLSSDDADYQALTPIDVGLVNQDDDVAGISIAPAFGLTTSEQGMQDEIAVVLLSEPAAEVRIPLSSSDSSEGTLSATELLFTSDNWSVPQMVVITGVDDAMADGNQSYSVVTSPAVSTDAKYNSLDAEDAAVTNLDDDTPGLAVVSVSDPITTEAGGTATFEVTLATQPNSDVTLSLVSSDLTEGSVEPQTLLFTSQTWDVPQLVTVTGTDDSQIDGPVEFEIQVQVAASEDSDYAALEAVNYRVENRDDDVAGLNISPVNGTSTSEAGATVELQVSLTAQPTDPVTVAFATADSTESLVMSDPLVFTPDDWNQPQAVSVAGVDDDHVDGTIEFDVVAETSSADAFFGALEDVRVPLANVDDDSAVVTLTAPQVAFDEETGSDGVSVEATIQVAGAVEGGFTLRYGTIDGTAEAAAGDYVETDDTISFSGMESESRVVTLLINSDNVLEPDETFSVVLVEVTGISESAASRITFEGSPLAITILDDDEASITLTGVSSVEGTGDGHTTFVFDVSVSNPVQGGLRIDYTTNDDTATLADGDYVDNDGTLAFDGEQAETKQISVDVRRDNRIELDEEFVVSLDEITFLDPDLAQSIDVDGATNLGVILNDDVATVSFEDDSSVAIEAVGAHSVLARLAVPDGGVISEEVSFEVVVLEGSTAISPDDYVLETGFITFPAGSGDGAIQEIQIALTTDEVVEDDEVIRLGLEAADEGIGGAVTVGPEATHEVRLTEDPMNAEVSGDVWFDANGNGQRDGSDIPLPGVLITLSGTDLRDQPITIVTMTDSQGQYRFADLPSGEYSIHEAQPSACGDGIDQLGQVDGVTAGTLHNDLISDILLLPGQQATEYSFSERGLIYTPMSRRIHLASSAALAEVIRDVVARGEALAGRPDLAAVIQQGLDFEVRQIGAEVQVTGSPMDDVMSFTPADAPAASHLLVVNGLRWELDAADVDRFSIDTGDGDDTLDVFDSPDDDLLRAIEAGIILSAADYRLEATSFELARAVSSEGGADRVDAGTFDYVLRLVGDWIE